MRLCAFLITRVPLELSESRGPCGSVYFRGRDRLFRLQIQCPLGPWRPELAFPQAVRGLPSHRACLPWPGPRARSSDVTGSLSIPSTYVSFAEWPLFIRCRFPRRGTQHGPRALTEPRWSCWQEKPSRLGSCPLRCDTQRTPVAFCSYQLGCPKGPSAAGVWGLRLGSGNVIGGSEFFVRCHRTNGFAIRFFANLFFRDGSPVVTRPQLLALITKWCLSSRK